MSSGIYDDDLVAHVQRYPGTSPFAEIRLIPTQAGPAGHATVKLSDAIEIEVDFTQINVLSGITLIATGDTQFEPALADSDIDILRELIGDDRADQVLHALSSNGDRPARIMSSSERRRNTSLPTRGTVDGRRLGQACALVDIANDDRETVVVRAVAALEAAVTSGEMKSRKVVAAVISQAESALVELEEEDARTSDDLVNFREDVRELVDRDPKIAFMVRDVIDAAQPLLSGRAAGVASYVREVLTESGDMLDDTSLDELVDSWRLSQADLSSPAFMVRSIAHEERAMKFPTPRLGRWHRTWHEHPGGSWVRILDPDDQMLIGLVPVRRNKLLWEAEALVPTTRPIHEWLIEVTDMPLPAKGSMSVRHIVEAIQLGRIATLRTATAGRRRTSSGEAWLACAEAWKSAGDLEREARARAYAEQMRVERPIFLADRVRRALGLEAP